VGQLASVQAAGDKATSVTAVSAKGGKKKRKPEQLRQGFAGRAGVGRNRTGSSRRKTDGPVLPHSSRRVGNGKRKTENEECK